MRLSDIIMNRLMTIIFMQCLVLGSLGQPEGHCGLDL